MGRTADQRSGHRTFNKSWVHPDHTEFYQVHRQLCHASLHYTVSSAHSVHTRNASNFLVSIGLDSSSSIRTCKYYTGRIHSINTLSS